MEYDPNAANIAMLEGYVAEARPFEDMFSMKGKVAVVTGGTSGLGFNIALRLLQGGANVVISGYIEVEGEYSIDILRREGYGPDRVIYCKADVSKEDEVANLVQTAADTFGSLDAYVNSAATWSYAHVYDISLKEWQRIMETNVNGAFLGVKHASKYMIEHGVQGKITLITSNSAWLPYPLFGGYPHYSTSKGAANSLAIESAKELKRYGIMVNAVAPGGMVTQGSAGNLCAEDLDEEKQDDFYEELMAWQNDGTQSVDSVAIVAYAMCTAMSDGMTGEIVVADAGMSHNIMKFQPELEAFPPEEE